MSEPDDHFEADENICGTCGGDGMIMLSEAGPSEWGEDCFCEEDRLIDCPECCARVDRNYRCEMVMPTPKTTLHMVNFSIPRSWSTMSRKRRRHWLRHIKAVCHECLGVGGVDSGGVTPWGAPITVPCPSCSPHR